MNITIILFNFTVIIDHLYLLALKPILHTKSLGGLLQPSKYKFTVMVVYTVQTACKYAKSWGCWENWCSLPASIDFQARPRQEDLHNTIVLFLVAWTSKNVGLLPIDGL